MDPIQMQQTYLYWVNLPQFILNFKLKVVSFLLPHLLELKRYLNDQSNNQVVNPAVIVIALVIVLIVLKNIWSLLFEKRSSAGQTTDSKELNNEVNDLKKQLKSLKTSFHQLTKQLNNKQLSSESQIPHQKVQRFNQLSASDETLNNLLNLYNISLDQNKSLINYVLQSQCQVLKQLKKFKKLNKKSISSSGWPPKSTVRSKTAQKKVQTKDKSPTKAVNSLLKSQIKKIEPKTVQKQEQKPLVSVLKQQKSQVPIKKQLKPQIPIKKQVRIQVPTKNQLKQQIPIKATQQPITKTTEQQPKLQVKPPTFQAPIKRLVKVPVAPQKIKVPTVPLRKINQKLQKSITIQQETKQQIVMPVTISPEIPSVHNEVKVEFQTVQTVIKETQITENVQQNNQIKSTKVLQFSSAEETKITTIEENAPLKDQNIEQNIQLKTTSQEVEQIIIVAPQKPPQLKKGIAPPGMKPGMKRTPPPPPTRK